MRRKLLVLTSFFTIFCSVTSCGVQMPEGTRLLNSVKEAMKFDSDLEKDKGYLTLKTAENKFSSDIFEAVYKESDDNFVVSPASIFLNLSVLASLADGEGKSEIIEALNVDSSTLENYYEEFLSSLLFSNNDSSLLITNSAWIDSSYKIIDEVGKNLGEKYLTYLYETSFSENLENAKKALNIFIKDKTKGLIDIEFPVTYTTALVLLNTLYFKDIRPEELEFDKEVSFLNENGNSKKISLLEGDKEEGQPYVDEKFTTFYATMKNGNVLHFVLPNKGYSLDDIMTSETIDEVIDIKDYGFTDGVEVYYTRPYFPEFKIEYTDSIKEILENYFGIADVFNENTLSLANILENSFPLYCEEIIHAAKLDVSKSGVEGAAITGTIMAPISSEPGVELEFIVDRPFGVIVENSRGSIIFTGAVRNL